MHYTAVWDLPRMITGTVRSIPSPTTGDMVFLRPSVTVQTYSDSCRLAQVAERPDSYTVRYDRTFIDDRY